MSAQLPTTQLTSRKRTRKQWRCFHCDEVFTSFEKAQFHFGATECTQPFCQIPEEEVRQMEKQLEAYRNEDTALHRQIASMETKHAQALMRAEEQGYDRGLRDGMRGSAICP